MATHSGVLAWRIPGTGEPDGLPSMGLHRVGHDWNDLAAAATIQLLKITVRTLELIELVVSIQIARVLLYKIKRGK